MNYMNSLKPYTTQSGITSIDPKSLTKRDLKQIARVEQDMWAREE
jgi:hypothetical protein